MHWRRRRTRRYRRWHLRRYGSDNRSSVMSLEVSNAAKPEHTFDSAEMGAIAHLYRGEVYRSTIWRTQPERQDCGERSFLSLLIEFRLCVLPLLRMGELRDGRVRAKGDRS